MTASSTRPLTARQQRVLAYLKDHPNSTAADVAHGTGLKRADELLNGLYARRLIGRQYSMFGRQSVAPILYSAGEPPSSTTEGGWL